MGCKDPGEGIITSPLQMRNVMIFMTKGAENKHAYLAEPVGNGVCQTVPLFSIHAPGLA